MRAQQYCLLLLLLLSPFKSFAEQDFKVNDVEGMWRDGVYHIDIRITSLLSGNAIEALHKGVALTIVLDVYVTKSRRYWLDKQVASLSQRYVLRYHALSDQYLIENLNSGVKESFSSLQTALDVMGDIDDLPILDRRNVQASERYYARARVRLDLDALPVPLRMLAYFMPNWQLSSDWYIWTLRM
ncbi:hypothetical protein MNBD_GAMMA16-1179 [hydrothermal vent metagenome]|uniref:Proline rich signal peptide protein n=1 Tax=hydrothermal vent metagenome TaxID=652676 RepID=A0A3B0ZAT1_9ZZZZ